MSRIGKEPIQVPSTVKVAVEEGFFVAEGPKGKVSERMLKGISVDISDGTIRVQRADDSGDLRAKHGLMRALLANAVNGVTEGFVKRLEVHGVGYRVEVQGREVHLSLGFSHRIVFPIPEHIEIEVDKANNISVSGVDRQLVGQVAAELRSLRKPDPYKGKGIRYKDEIIHRKVGKAGAVAAK